VALLVLQHSHSGWRDAGRDEAGGPKTVHRWLGFQAATHLPCTTLLRARLANVFLSATFCIAHRTHCEHV